MPPSSRLRFATFGLAARCDAFLREAGLDHEQHRPSNLAQHELDGLSLLTRCDVALHSMVQEDVDHSPDGSVSELCGISQRELALAIEANRTFKRANGNQ